MAVVTELDAALAADEQAGMAWAALAPSHRREYVTWVSAARRPDTRARRIAETVRRIKEGDRR